MAFIEDGDEVIVFEPCFDLYISNIRMAGGVVRYVPLSPSRRGHGDLVFRGLEAGYGEAEDYI